jgi:hypothetical protein
VQNEELYNEAKETFHEDILKSLENVKKEEEALASKMQALKL